MMYCEHITDLIGNTPLLRLDPQAHGLDHVQLYAKLEFYHPFGSVKDRAAWAMLRAELAEITTQAQTLIEASSGNTAKALRILGGLYGIDLRAITNRIKVDEVRDLLRLLDTDIVELPGLSECPDPYAPQDVYSMIEATMAEHPGTFRHLSQYTNPANVAAHYSGTGHEIHTDLAAAGVERIDYLFGGLGTTGSTRGAATYLMQQHPNLRTVAVVSDHTDFIPGIRSEHEMWEVGLFQPEFYDQIVVLNSAQAVQGTLALATQYGVLAGPTSGAAYTAALDTLAAAPRSADAPLHAVFIACDRLEPYLSYLKKRSPERFGRSTGRYRPTSADLAAAPELTAQELATWEPGEQPLLIDTRGAMAYRIAHVPGSLNIPDDHLCDLLDHGIPFPRERPLVFICPTGAAARRFTAHTRHAGQHSFTLAGGITAWRDAGLPLTRGSAHPTNT